jgi:hypothetical protein
MRDSWCVFSLLIYFYLFTFNQVLLGVWGPIITSVGNLLTIVLVFISDVLFGAGVAAVTAGSVVGCGIIVAAFGVLAYDMLDKRRWLRE